MEPMILWSDCRMKKKVLAWTPSLDVCLLTMLLTLQPSVESLKGMQTATAIDAVFLAVQKLLAVIPDGSFHIGFWAHKI